MKNERQIISRLKKILGSQKSGVKVGIGDDAAVFRSLSPNTVVTVDALVEGVHFDLSYATPAEVGVKAMAVNLSDIAAMGAKPAFAVVSVAVPISKAQSFLPALYRGISKMAKQHGVAVIGGNLSQSPSSIFIDITMFGSAKTPCLRSGARVGDWVGVIGGLGEASLGLEVLKRFGRAEGLRRWPKLCRAQLTPQPQVSAGIEIGKRRLVHALIDVSDGLVSELNHLASESKVAIEVRLEKIPLSRALLNVGRELGRSPLDFALGGGEDYALLFAAPERYSRALERLGACRIGSVVKGKSGVHFIENGKRRPIDGLGFDHFR